MMGAGRHHIAVVIPKRWNHFLVPVDPREEKEAQQMTTTRHPT